MKAFARTKHNCSNDIRREASSPLGDLIVRSSCGSITLSRPRRDSDAVAEPSQGLSVGQKRPHRHGESGINAPTTPSLTAGPLRKREKESSSQVEATRQRKLLFTQDNVPASIENGQSGEIRSFGQLPKRPRAKIVEPVPVSSTSTTSLKIVTGSQHDSAPVWSDAALPGPSYDTVKSVSSSSGSSRRVHKRKTDSTEDAILGASSTCGKRRRVDSSSSENITNPRNQKATFASSYMMGELLGRGGFGSVYAGIRRSDNTKVAIKLIRKREGEQFITLPGSTTPLPLEVALLMRVSEAPACPYIVRLLDWFELPSFFILILERPVPCMDLYDFCSTFNGRLDESLARIIMLQVLVALKHCQDRGVFHRDVKLENILINPEDFSVKLIDFGCGDLLTQGFYSSFAGTKTYCPPEWMLNRSYQGGPATVWSLGILLFTLLNGDVPFQNSHEAVFGRPQFKRGVSCDCRNLIHACLRKDPTRRPLLEDIFQHKWLQGTE